MNKENLNICQVSLSGNIPIILENYKNFCKFYNTTKFYIICPRSEIKLFKKKLNFKNIFIISEEKILSFNKFQQISNKLLIKKKYFNKIQDRLKWYYQQALKISFIFDFVKDTNEEIIIWDADTILLKKINFFKKDLSISYGTTSEFHKAYYDTNRIILKKLPKYYISCLAQFISLSLKEYKSLEKSMIKFSKKKYPTSEWISIVMIKAICKAHNEYNGSMFSEYELIGQSNLIYKKSSQKLISGLREFLDGRLTNMQKKITLLLGYSYIAYEHTHQNKYSKNMLKRDQSWFLFIKLLIRKTSNKFFRGIKHKILNIIYNG